MSKRTLILLAVLAALAGLLAGLTGGVEAKPCTHGHPCPSPTGSPPPSGDPVITAAGDIADPAPSAATKATGQLVSSIQPAVALTLGDNQYEERIVLRITAPGTAPTWGTFLSTTRPAVGNHEYKSSLDRRRVFRLLRLARAATNYYFFQRRRVAPGLARFELQHGRWLHAG